MITTDNFPRFEREYLKAVAAGKESFIFEGEEVLTNYAKYVVEYVMTGGSR